MSDVAVKSHVDAFLQSSTLPIARTALDVPSNTELDEHVTVTNIIEYDDSTKTLALSDKNGYLKYIGDTGSSLYIPIISTDFNWGIGCSVALRNSSTDTLSVFGEVLAVTLECNTGDNVLSPNAVVQLLHTSTNNWDLL